MKNMNQIMWVKDPMKKMVKPLGRDKICGCNKDVTVGCVKYVCKANR